MDEDGAGQTESPAGTVAGRVDAVIQDLSGGRVAPRQVDQLADAVSRARMDHGLRKALGSRL
jgi:hypothetical protein